MNLLVIGNDRALFDQTSGVAKRIKEYATLVEKMEVVVYSKKSLHLEKYSVANLTVTPTNSRGVFFYIFDAFRLGLRILKKWKVTNPQGKSIITVQDHHEVGIVGVLLKCVSGAHLQVQEHADYYTNHNWRNERVLNFFKYYFGFLVIRYADGVRVVSNRIKETLHRKLNIPYSRIVAVHVRSQFEKIVESEVKLNLHEKYPDAEKIILTTPRLVPQKNLPLLINSFAGLLKKHPKALLVIVGKGPKKKSLMSLVQGLHIEKHVVFEDWTDDVASYMKTADIYALSSSWEGWGMVVIEAMAAGLPIIMTDVGCAHEVFKDGVNGIIVPVEDENSFVEGLISLYENEKLCQVYSQNNKQAIEDFITLDDHLLLHKKSYEVCFSNDDQ